MSQRIGLRQSTAGRRHGRGPRLHDMRHRFAARTLIEWYRAGLDAERELPKLATYLGHAHVADTYWYLEAVPELGADRAVLAAGDRRHGRPSALRRQGSQTARTPLRCDAAALLAAWLRAQRGQPQDPVFPSTRGTPLSRDAVEQLLAKHVATAQQRCPSLQARGEQRVAILHPAGLRVSEVVRLRVSDIDSERMLLRRDRTGEHDHVKGGVCRRHSVRWNEEQAKRRLPACPDACFRTHRAAV